MAQVTGEHLAQVHAELRGQRLVQPVLRAQLGLERIAHAAAGAGDGLHRVTGRGVHEDEVEHHDGEHQGQALQQPREGELNGAHGALRYFR